MPKRRLGTPTDASAAMVAYRHLSSAMLSNDDSDWPVYSLMLSLLDLQCCDDYHLLFLVVWFWAAYHDGRHGQTVITLRLAIKVTEGTNRLCPKCCVGNLPTLQVHRVHCVVQCGGCVAHLMTSFAWYMGIWITKGCQIVVFMALFCFAPPYMALQLTFALHRITIFFAYNLLILYEWVPIIYCCVFNP